MRPTVLVLVAFLAFLVAEQSHGQPLVRPLSFQGILTDTLGNPLPNGPHDMRFSVFDSPEGGTELWFEQKNVPTARGLFNVMLGDAKPMAFLDFSTPLWLGIRVDGLNLNSRMEFSGTGFSYRAGLASNAVVADSLSGGRFAHGTVVRSVNGATENITLAAGSNISITHTNDTLRISATGGTAPGVLLPYADSTSGGPAAFKVKNTGSGIGVFGASENGNGVQGESSTGNGVTGKSGATNGVYGLSSNEAGFGMSGRNSAISSWGFIGGQLPTHIDHTGRGRAGIYGECVEASDKFASAYGVAGYATTTVSGHSGGVGVYGKSEHSYGMMAEGRYGIMAAGTNLGVYGWSDSLAVLGIAEGPSCTGIEGLANSTSSGPAIGVMGNVNASSGYGVECIGSGGAAALGCIGDFSQSGGSFKANPTTTVWTTNKPATVKLNDGTQVKLFTEEAAELYFADYGEGRLNGGRAHIELDPVFLQTITVDSRHPLKAFVQLEDDCQGVYVTAKTTTGFDVVELKGGTSNAAFTYRVVCKRKYYEDERLATEKDDIYFNTSMLQRAWPEVVEREKDERGRRQEHFERAFAAAPESKRGQNRTSRK
jgi:hypothetical protein